MYTPQRTTETAEWLKECDIELINSEAEHTTHFATRFALHNEDKELADNLVKKR